MARTTKHPRFDELPPEAFYDALAPDYDALTNFDQRFVVERPFFRNLVERFGIRSAVDAGAGTGFHSLLLAQLGVTVTAVDLSDAMLRGLSANGRRLNLHIHAIKAGFGDLSSRLTKPVDALFCLGNTLAHADSDDTMLKWVGEFARVVRPGGIVVLQTLNYDRILSEKVRVQGVRETGSKIFVRFYDYREHDIVFNVLTLERRREGLQSHMESVVLHPVTSACLTSLVTKLGLRDVHVFGSIAQEPYDPARSRDLVVIAARSPGDSLSPVLR